MPSEYPECAHMKCPNMDVCVCVCVCVCVREVVELRPLWPAGWHNHGSEQFRVREVVIPPLLNGMGMRPCITQHGLGMRLCLTVYGCGLKSKGGISGSEGGSFTAKSITASNFIVYIYS